MVLEAPLYQDGNTYPARLDRQLIEDVFDTEGVIKTTLPGALLVTARAAGANMSVDIAAGRAVIKGDDEANQGSYRVISTAVENRPIGAAPGSNSRIDLVVARIRDAAVTGGVSSDWVLEVIPGTVAASPVAPAVPNSAIALAQVLVAAGTLSIDAAKITDRRPTASSAAYVPNALVDAKGDLLVGSAADALVRLPVGTGNGRALITDSSTPSGLTWGGSPLSQLHLPANALHAAGGAPSFSTLLGYYGAWLLDSASTEAVSAGVLDVPDEWSKVAADVYLMNPSASTGNYTVRLIFGNHAAGAAVAASGSAFFATAALGQNVLQKITLPDITVTPGNLVLVGIERAGADATDTLPNDIAVLHISLRRAA